MDKQATNLVDALKAFGPAPLEFRGAKHPFYVNRDDEPLRELRLWLEDSVAPAKFLLAGHRGSGKSTELNRLTAQPEIWARYAIVKFSALEQLDLLDFDYIDLLIQTAAITFNRLVSTAALPLELASDTISLLDRWRRTVSEKITDASQGMGAEVEAGGGLDILKAFFARFQGRLQVEHTTRKITRETIEPRLSDFLQTIEVFYKEVDRALARRGQRLLLIVEDLDKIPAQNKALALFREKGALLAHPPCSIIYQVPVSIFYAIELPHIADTFGMHGLVNSVPVRQRSGAQAEVGINLIRNFVARRIAPGLLEPEAIIEIVEMSGGVLQQAQRVTAKACLRALGFERRMILKEDVAYAARELRFEMERYLSSAHLSILAEVESTQMAFPADPEAQRLVHTQALIEYCSGERWFVVNPLLKRTLANWREMTSVQEKASS